MRNPDPQSTRLAYWWDKESREQYEAARDRELQIRNRMVGLPVQNEPEEQA